MSSSDVFLEKLKVDVRDAILLKRQLNERTDAIRADASRYLHTLQKQVQKAYDGEDDTAKAQEEATGQIALRVRNHLDRIANL